MQVAPPSCSHNVKNTPGVKKGELQWSLFRKLATGSLERKGARGENTSYKGEQEESCDMYLVLFLVEEGHPLKKDEHQIYKSSFLA